MQTLANGNVIVGWGEAGTFSEYNSHDKMLMYASLPADGTTVVNGYKVANSWQTYRVLQDQWTESRNAEPALHRPSTQLRSA